MAYGKVHRFLLRSIASRGVLSMEEIEEVVNKFTDNNNTTSVANLIKEINEEIKVLKQQIKITNDELTDEKVVVFMFLGFDETSKSQNVFSATELEYFRLLVEEIMSTAVRQITGIHAMNLVNRLKTSFTKTDGQKLLDTWCRMRYLATDENNYALGVRAIHEFESYLRQNMPDSIEECFLCKQIVFRGCNCPACGLAVHTRCLNKYLEKVQKWPCCKADFSQSQLDRLVAESSRPQLTQTQVLDETSQASAEYNTIVEPSQELSQDIEMTQDLFPEITPDLLPELSQEMLQEITQEITSEPSRRVTRKRKRV